MSDDELYKQAEKRADEKISFYRYLYGFVIGNVFLFIINFLFSPGEWWFYWITILSGIGLIVKFFQTFVFNEVTDRDKMIEKEMEKMKK